MIQNLQKLGGLAALAMAVAFIISFVVFFGCIDAGWIF